MKEVDKQLFIAALQIMEAALAGAGLAFLIGVATGAVYW